MYDLQNLNFKFNNMNEYGQNKTFNNKLHLNSLLNFLGCLFIDSFFKV